MARIKVWNGTTWDYVGNDIANLVTTGGSQTLTNKVIDGSQLVDGSVTDAKLAESSNNRPLMTAHNIGGGTTGSGTLTFNTTQIDTASAFNGSTYTVPKAGYYFVAFSGFSDSGAAAGGIQIMHNGVSTGRQYNTNGAGYHAIGIQKIIECAVNDTILVDSDFTMHGSNSSSLSIIYMGPA